MEVENHFRKFKLLLNYVLEGKVALDERNIEQLLLLLEQPSGKKPGGRVLDTPRFSDLIFDAIKNIPNATTAVATFLIEIVTILFKNELQFNKLQVQGFQKSTMQYCIMGVLERNPPPPGLHLVAIKLATAQMSHCSGIALLLENKVWRSILSSNTHQRPRHIAKATYKFISDLVLKLCEYKSESELIEVLGYIIEPITTSEYLQLDIIDPKTDEILAEKIQTFLNALLVVLTDTGDSTYNIVGNLLRSYFLIDHHLYTILHATRLTSMVTLLNDIAFRYLYGVYKNMLFTDKSDVFCNEIVAYYHNCIVRCVKKRNMQAITDFCVKCIIFWANFEKMNKDTLKFPLTFERNGHKLELSNQLLLHLLVPLFNFTYYSQPNDKVKTFEDFLEENCLNILDTVTDHILSTCYLMKTLFDSTVAKQAVIETAKELFRLKGYLSATQAGIIYQSLFHALGVFIVSDEEDRLILNDNPIQSSNDEKLLSLLLDLIHMLLKEHNISWYENVEIVCLQARLINLLKQNILNTKQIVKALDLIDICVKKFLSPYMTLLVDSHQDSDLTEIGALMKTYMQHDDWGVKDSALNLLHSCTDVAFVKYTPLQKVIHEENLMFIAVKLALTDPECYVQSTSLKCLAAASKIDSIWRNIVHRYPHIYLHLVCTLKNNPEGMVRKEAANVLTGIYVNQKVDQNFQKSLYEVMTTAALDDLHSEVQSAALRFWYNFFLNQLAIRGMVDGKFPSVMFSREKRKIITLNELEIARQLTSIMEDLSSSGFLSVLLECMNEVNNIEIIKHAHCMAKNLVEILDYYKFQKVVDNDTTPPPEDEMAKEIEQDLAMDLTFETSNEEFRNIVLDEILSVYQSELIMNLYDGYQEIKSNGMEEDYKSFIPRKELVRPNKFIETFRNTDYVTIINNKKQWNADVYNSLDVLLDEMIDV